MDWSRLGRVSPKESKKEEESGLGGLDWGLNSSAKKEEEDELKLEWSDNDDDDDDEDDDEKVKNVVDEKVEDTEAEVTASTPVKTDIMAQQLKFMACLKIMMEELSTIATGFEMEGGIIRSQLYVWLEKEV